MNMVPAIHIYKKNNTSTAYRSQ